MLDSSVPGVQSCLVGHMKQKIYIKSNRPIRENEVDVEKVMSALVLLIQVHRGRDTIEAYRHLSRAEKVDCLMAIIEKEMDSKIELSDLRKAV